MLSSVFRQLEHPLGGRLFSDVIDAPAEAGDKMNLVLEFAHAVPAEPTPIRVQIFDGAAEAGEIGAVLKTAPPVVDASIYKTVGVNEDGLVIGQAFEQTQLVHVAVRGVWHQDELIKRLRILVLLLRDDRKGPRPAAVSTVGTQQIVCKLVVVLRAGGNGYKATSCSC